MAATDGSGSGVFCSCFPTARQQLQASELQTLSVRYKVAQVRRDCIRGLTQFRMLSPVNALDELPVRRNGPFERSEEAAFDKDRSIICAPLVRVDVDERIENLSQTLAVGAVGRGGTSQWRHAGQQCGPNEL